MQRRHERRTRNSGSISRTESGYKGRVDLGIGPDGKRKVKTFSGKSRPEIESKMREFRAELTSGRDPFAKSPNLRDFLDLWLATKRNSVAPKTMRCYCQCVENHIKPSLGHVEVGKIRPAQVEALLQQKSASGLSADSVRLIRTTLNTAYKYALRMQLVPVNPVACTDPPKREHKTTQILSADHAKALIKACEGKSYGLAIVLAVHTGLRKGEILGLKWEDVDFERGVLKVCRQLERINGEWRDAPLKTAKSRRAIPLPAELLGQLKEHKARQLLDSMRDDFQSFGFVFCTRVGTPYDERNLLSYLKIVLGEAKLPPIRFHDLRHTHATLLREADVDIKTVSERLGHSNINLTASLYTHGVEKAQVEATERIRKLLGD